MRATVLAAALLGGLEARQAASSTMTSRDWKHLRKNAKTAEEFRRCAEWCRKQADGYRERLAVYEAELKALETRPPNRTGPKYPPTAEHLRMRVEHYRGLVKHWTGLAEDYEHKAAAHQVSR